MNTIETGLQFKDQDQYYGLRVISLSLSTTDILVNLGLPPLNRNWWQVDLSADEIAEYQPDLIVCQAGDLHLARQTCLVMEQSGQKIPEILLCQTDDLGSGIATIRKLGKRLGLDDKAREIIRRENSFLRIAKAKARLGAARYGNKPKCVVMLGFSADDRPETNDQSWTDLANEKKKARNLVLAGDGSFQNQITIILQALAPNFSDKPEKNIRSFVTAEEFASLAPDFVFTTNPKLQSQLAECLAGTLAHRIPAVLKGQILSFPAEMLGHFSCSYGYISLWLASSLYPESFADKKTLLRPDSALARQVIDLPESLGISAELASSRLYDLPARTIILRSSSKRQILSSLHGWRGGISWIGNHECPHPAWPLLTWLGMEETDRRVLALHRLPEAETCLLHTGADISLYALSTQQYGPFTVSAIVTAGVLFNALRAGSDKGQFVEAGTINIILLTNASLSHACLVQCLIQATEAKVAALQSLDIRSCQSGLQATGTGTDNCIVVSGTGLPATMAGGHTKLGELVARACYAAVREAVCRQHQFGPARPLPQRLAERSIFWNHDNLRRLEKSKVAQAAISASLALEDAARHDLVAEMELLLNKLGKLAKSEGMSGQDINAFLNRLANARQNRYCDRPGCHPA